MPTIHDDITALEQHVAALSKAAAMGAPAEKMAEGHAFLVRLAQKIKSPNQSKNETYYGLGAPDVYEVGAKAPKPHTVSAAQQQDKDEKMADGEGQEKKDQEKEASMKLSYDVYASNTALANETLSKAEAANAKIDALVKAGKKFNAARAKADLHAVTSKVAGILQDVDLTTPWVAADLQKLAARATELHDLFAPAKA